MGQIVNLSSMGGKIGKFPEVGVADARERHFEMRSMIERVIDPFERRRQQLTAHGPFAGVGLVPVAPPLLLAAGAAQQLAAIVELQRLQPQLVVLVAAGAAAPEFIARYQQAAGASARVAVPSVVGGRGLTDRLQAQVAGIMTSLFYPNPWSGARRVSREYQAAKQRSGQPQTLLNLEGCIKLRIAAEALKAAGDEFSGPGLRRVLARGLPLDLGGYQLRLRPGARAASAYTSLGICRPDGRVKEWAGIGPRPAPGCWPRPGSTDCRPMASGRAAKSVTRATLARGRLPAVSIMRRWIETHEGLRITHGRGP